MKAIAINSILGLCLAVPTAAEPAGRGGSNDRADQQQPTATVDIQQDLAAAASRYSPRRGAGRHISSATKADASVLHINRKGKGSIPHSGRPKPDLERPSPEPVNGMSFKLPSRPQNYGSLRSPAAASEQGLDATLSSQPGRQNLSFGDESLFDEADQVQRSDRKKFDDGPLVVEAVEYGGGLAGTMGVPRISYVGRVAPGSTVRIFIENSLGAETTGLLMIGSREMQMRARSGAVVLSSGDVGLVRLRLHAGTNEVEYTIPENVEGDLFLQATERDDGAVGGWSFTKGLKLLM